MSIVLSLQTLGSFLLYFAAALVAQGLFLTLYMAVTTHKEFALIRQGNTAAAISLAGAGLGFSLPLASAVVHSVSPLDMAVWSVIALVVQLLVFRAVDFAIRGISSHIEEGNIAAAITLAAASLVIGMINAASMSY